MPKLYEYQTNYHRVTETLKVRECGQGVYIGVNSVVQMPLDVEDDEKTTSIVLPLNEVKPLIEGLLKATDKDAPVLLALDTFQLATLFFALEMFIETMQGKVVQEDIPYELASSLKARLKDLVALNPTKLSKIGEVL